MARGFGSTYGTGSTDQIKTAYTGTPTTQSWAFWEWRNGAGGNNVGVMFDKRDSSTPGYRFFGNNETATNYRFVASWNSGSTILTNTVARPSTGVWTSWVITYDSSSTSNDAVIYQNGTSVTVTRTTSPTGTADTNSDPYSIGNLPWTSPARNWDGMIAEFGVWSAILTAAEAAALAKGYTPNQIRPASLVEYVPLVRDNISRKNAAPTITGTAVQPHPRIIMPHRRMARRFTTAAGNSGKPYYYYQQQGGG